MINHLIKSLSDDLSLLQSAKMLPKFLSMFPKRCQAIIFSFQQHMAFVSGIYDQHLDKYESF